MIKIEIEDYMPQIRKMAVRALANMNHNSGYVLGDMISEGILVFYKDALPTFKRKGQDGHRANFKTYLTVCLRNHYFGLMKSSFRKAVNDDCFDEHNRQIREDPRVTYTRRRIESTHEVSPVERASFNIAIEEIKQGLNDDEDTYLRMTMAERSRRDIRGAMGVSAAAERRIRRVLQKKMAVLIKQ